MDKATIRHAQHDPTELGFHTDFVHPQPEVAAALAHTTCPLIFVRGNHEDHLWLDRLEQTATDPIFPIDAYQRLYCLKTGVPYTFSRGAETITLLGIGRIAQPAGADHPRPKHIQPHELERLYQLEPFQPDVLLTHDSARDAIFPGSGIEEIKLIIDRYQPSYHFFGHYGGPCRQGFDANGTTYVCKLADLDWDHTDRGKVVEAGSMALLRWKSADDHHFEVLDQPWLKEYTAFSWKYL